MEDLRLLDDRRFLGASDLEAFLLDDLLVLPVDLDAFVTNISANVLPNSKTYKNATGKTKYFGMYNLETKCSTVWVGLEEPITKMYNNLKKDNTIKLTELF